MVRVVSGPPGRRDPAGWASRVERILDGAATCVLQHGYDGTSIDLVARGAGVGKGTIYLHFAGRDTLFAAVLRRERLALAGAVRATSPPPATLHDLLVASVEATMSRPLLQAVLRQDLAVLGRLAGAEPATDAVGTARGFGRYLAHLRARGLIRTDRSAVELLASVAAVLLGFLATAPMLATARLPELVADTAGRALDRGVALTAGEAAALAELTNRYLDDAVTQATAAYRLAAGLENL